MIDTSAMSHGGTAERWFAPVMAKSNQRKPGVAHGRSGSVNKF
jgi:hypothetical protein